MNALFSSFIGFVGLLLAAIGVAALVWWLWWLWKRSEDDKQDLGIEIKTGEPEIDVAVPAVAVEADIDVPDVEIEPDLPEVEAAPPEPDNLQRIEGIGPKIASVLQAAGITTFDALANADDDQIRQILEDADPRLVRLANAETWREQASLAAAGDWDGLSAVQAGLKGGRRV